MQYTCSLIPLEWDEIDIKACVYYIVLNILLHVGVVFVVMPGYRPIIYPGSEKGKELAEKSLILWLRQSVADELKYVSLMMNAIGFFILEVYSSSQSMRGL